MSACMSAISDPKSISVDQQGGSVVTQTLFLTIDRFQANGENKNVLIWRFLYAILLLLESVRFKCDDCRLTHLKFIVG